MRILFIKSTLNSSASPQADFGICLLSAVLKKHNHKVDLYIIRSWENIGNLEYRIKLTKPDIIAFSTYASLFNNLIKVSNILKKKFPKILQVMGGIHLILNPNEFLKAPSIDAICLGEGEYAFVKFIENYSHGDNSHLDTEGFWTRKGKTIKKNPGIPFVENINKLPFPDRDIFLRQEMPYGDFSIDGKINLNFLFTRGCPFKCTYCSNHALANIYGPDRYVRRMSPTRAIEWLKNDLSQYACDCINIVDDTFTLDKKWVMEFLDLYRKDIKMPFVCLLRIGTFNKDILKRLKSAGCIGVTLGIESGDEQYRKKILNRFMSDEEILKGFKLVKQAKIRSGAFFMIGLPGETPRMFLKTIKLLAKINPGKLVINTFYPYLGTELHKYSKKMGFIKGKQPQNFIVGIESILKMPNFSQEDILYYFYKYEDLIKFSQPTKNLTLKLWRKLLFIFYSVPPSSKWFILTQICVYIYKHIFLVRNSKQKIKSHNQKIIQIPKAHF